MKTATGTGRATASLGWGSGTPSAEARAPWVLLSPLAQHGGCLAQAQCRDASAPVDGSAPAPSAKREVTILATKYIYIFIKQPGVTLPGGDASCTPQLAGPQVRSSPFPRAGALPYLLLPKPLRQAVGWKRMRPRGTHGAAAPPPGTASGHGHPRCSVTVRTPEAMHIFLFQSGRFCPGWHAGAGMQPQRRDSASLTFTWSTKTGSHYNVNCIQAASK